MRAVLESCIYDIDGAYGLLLYYVLTQWLDHECILEIIVIRSNILLHNNIVG